MNADDLLAGIHRDRSPAPLTARLLAARTAAAELLAAGALLLCGLPRTPAGWMTWSRWALAAAALAAGWKLCKRAFHGRADRLGIREDRQGLHELYRFERNKLYPWESVLGVEERGYTLTIHTSLGDIEAGPDVSNRALLALSVAQRLEERRRAQSEPSVTPQQVAEWLGVEPGEQVTAPARELLGSRALDAVWGCCLLLWLPLMLKHLADGTLLRSEWSTLFLIGLIGGPMLCRPRRIEATPERLRLRRLRGTQQFSWDDLRSIQVRGAGGVWAAGWQVLARDMTHARDLLFTLPEGSPEAARLAHAIEQALAARQSGEVLPRMNDVSAAAISPVSASVSAERGVSRAEGEGDGA
ncbi:MAG: hypothetical protein HYU66_07660 [Armatimonadetes bacterium]|nr:hypothetical protein [Armatimonadota bacterium]